eukprot:scaffold18293_cov68-Phaeocystis_antarctica.AAC.5
MATAKGRLALAVLDLELKGPRVLLAEVHAVPVFARLCCARRGDARQEDRDEPATKGWAGSGCVSFAPLRLPAPPQMACASVRALAGVEKYSIITRFSAGLRRPRCALQCAIACDGLVACGVRVDGGQVAGEVLASETRATHMLP